MRFKLLLCCLLPVSLFAQERKPIPAPPKSPNVSAMERYGNFEVNLFRGLPEISIPLYEVKTRHHTIPVTLSYHASGIKVTEPGSWAGLGWSVNAGGFVGRQRKGDLDEFSYLKPGFQLKKPNEIDERTIEGYYYLRDILNGFLDGQPDVFSYSVPGKYGHFFHTGPTDEPVTVPYDPIKITRTVDPVYSGSIAHWQLTDEVGKYYVFGNSNGESVFEESITKRGSKEFGCKSAWQLTSMYSVDKTDSVVFRYHPTQSYTIFEETEDYVTATGGITKILPTLCNMENSIQSSSVSVWYRTAERQLKEILFDNGKVEFIQSPANRNDLACRSLEQINVYVKEKGSMKLLKSIRFHQSYFTGQFTSRLRLDSISIQSASAAEKMVYRFTYNSAIVPLNSKSKDYWGYYNGSGASTLVPGTYSMFPYGSSHHIGGSIGSRNPSETNVQMAMLRRIQFPTGGHTLFNFEPHQYSHGNNGDALLGGGVRIKSIYSYTEEGSQPQIKTYTYGRFEGDESGKGILNSIIPVNFNYMESYYEHWGNPDPQYSFLGGPVCRYTERKYSSTATVDNNDYDGTMVYYPFVTEYLGTIGNNTGKLTYEYSYAADQLTATYPQFMPGTLTSHWLRGKLTSKKEYERTSPVTFQLKKETVHYYRNLKDSTYKEVGCLVGERFVRSGAVFEGANYGQNGWDVPYITAFFDMKSGAYLPVETVETIYNGVQTLVNKTLISYNDRLQPRNVVTIASNGDSLFQMFKYATDYYSASTANDAAKGIKRLSDNNVVSVPIEILRGIRSPGGNLRITGGKINTFFPDKPLQREEYQLETAIPLAGYTASIIDAAGNFTFPANYKRRLTFSAFDNKNNITEYFTEDGSLRHTLTWGHNGMLMTAKTDRATPAQVAYTSFEDTDKGGWSYNESAVKVMASATVSGLYAHDFAVSGSISRSTLPAGKYKVSYWSQTACSVNGGPALTIGPANAKGLKLFTHEVTVAAGGTINVTSSVAWIDELRLHPDGAMASTVAYHPSGQVSTEINGRDAVTTYEFDGLQRLKLVRDENNAILRQFSYGIDTGGGLSPNLPMIYYNIGTATTLRRNNCNAATEYGTEMTYVVPKGSFLSFVDQSDANAMAINEVALNAQQYANTNGECRPKTEVVWEPYNLHCQIKMEYGWPAVASNFTVINVTNESGTEDVTRFTVTRPHDDIDFGVIVNLVVHFAGGGYPDMPVTLYFDPREITKDGTVRTAPIPSYFRNGMSVVSVTRIPKQHFTGYKIYGSRRKRVGGEIVLNESNDQTGGEGPYFPPISGTPNLCDLPSPSTEHIMYLSSEFTGQFIKVCPTNQSAIPVDYTLPMGHIQSSSSQLDADTQAHTIWKTNGQQLANQAVCR